MMVRGLRHLLLDLDNTLYPKQAGLIDHIDQRIDDFLAERLRMEGKAVNALRQSYYRKYGTTLRGVKENHGIDPLEYIAHAYCVDVSRFIPADPKLCMVLQGIPWQKTVFSNSPMDYVVRVLEALNIRDLIEHIFDVSFSGYRGKPDPETYRQVLQALGATGEDCVMVEDYALNLLPAKELGMITVLIGEEKQPDYVDFRLNSIYELSQVWEALVGKI